MKLLFLLPEYYPHPGGGLATYNMGFLGELVKRGIQVNVILGSGVTVGNKEYVYEGVEIQELQPELLRRHKDRFKKFCLFPELQHHIAAAWAMWEQMDHGSGYDIIETTDWGLGSIPWVLSKDSPPFITQMHGSQGQIETFDPRLGLELQSDILRLIESNIFSASGALFTYSSSNKLFWETQLNRQVSYAPPPFKLGPLNTSDLKHNGFGLVIARIQHWKGPIVLCEALRRLKEDAPEILWIGRDTSYQENKRSMSEYLKKQYPDIWGIKIKPLGQLPHETVQEYIASAGFGIVPSLWDVFNFTCPELMSQMKPVICSRGAGASDLISDGQNGFLFDPNKPEGLANAILRLRNTSADDLGRIGNRARETVANILDPAKFIESRLQLYGDLLTERKEKMPISPWLAKFLSPSDCNENFAKILDQVPLRNISRYLISRCFAKYFDK